MLHTLVLPTYYSAIVNGKHQKPLLVLYIITRLFCLQRGKKTVWLVVTMIKCFKPKDFMSYLFQFLKQILHEDTSYGPNLQLTPHQNTTQTADIFQLVNTSEPKISFPHRLRIKIIFRDRVWFVKARHLILERSRLLLNKN